MATPKTPPVVKTVHKAGQGGQVPPTGNTVKPEAQHQAPPAGIKAPSTQNKKLGSPKHPSTLSYK